MSVKRFLPAAGAMVLVMAVATPVWAQRGGKKPPKTTCDESVYAATVEFRLPPDLLPPDTTWILPAIRPADDDKTVRLKTTYGDGWVRDHLVNPNDPTMEPLELDFSYPDDDHYTGPDVTQIDPRLTLMAYDDIETLSVPECGLMGMELDDLDPDTPPAAPTYYGRTGILWWDGEQQWILRHKPADNAGNIPTYTKIVRVDANTWVLTSRFDSLHPDPPLGCDSPCLLPHFASLQKEGSGHGKKAVPRTFSTPIMPVEIWLRVDCGVDDCPLPNGG